jgi:hypothetical protein
MPVTTELAYKAAVAGTTGSTREADEARGPPLELR